MAHTTTSVPVRQDPTAHPPSRDPRGALGWVLLAAGLAATGALILAVTSSGPAPQPAITPNSSLIDVPRYPEISERWLAHHSEMLGAGNDYRYAGWPAGVPQSADAAERYFMQQQAPAGWPEGVHRSADAAERFFMQQQAPAGWPEGVHRSADAAERFFARTK